MQDDIKAMTERVWEEHQRRSLLRDFLHMLFMLSMNNEDVMVYYDEDDDWS